MLRSVLLVGEDAAVVSNDALDHLVLSVGLYYLEVLVDLELLLLLIELPVGLGQPCSVQVLEASHVLVLLGFKEFIFNNLLIVS